MISGLHVVKSVRPGKPIRWYIYAWRGGPKIRVVEQPTRPRLTPEDVAAVAAAQAEAHKTEQPASHIAGVIGQFRRSKFWNELAPNTRKTWGVGLDRIEKQWKDVPIAALADPRARPKIIKWHRALAEGNARGADIAKDMLRRLFDWAIDEGLATHNPAEKMQNLYRRVDRASVIWLPEDLEAIYAVASQPLRDAMSLGSMTALRRDDLVSLRWDEVGDLAIQRIAAKRSRGKRYRVTIPRLPHLNALLDELRTRPRETGVETVLVNSYGKSWTGDGLASSFYGARAKANGGNGICYVERDPSTGKEQRIPKRLHDLRGTFATHLMTQLKSPLTDREIADVMGWSEQQVGDIRKRYVDDKAIVVALTRRLGQGTL
ncbi:MAG: tyrosine-type recombinase/integrase [Sphingomonas sp.]